MAWIKRNLIFVIIVAVGLLLTGYGGYLLYSTISDNSGANEEYLTTVNNLKEVQQKSPSPSKENIKIANADQEHIRHFLVDFRKSFAAFPPPPAEDEKGFKTYVEETLVRFRAEATNAGVQVPMDYAFAFSGLMGKLTYPPGNIGPWMQQLEEISAILDILYGAKINSLLGLQRVSVAPDDTGTADYLAVTSVTNQWGIVTPYKITFRGFSTEIAAVLEGFARSSNCFIVKSVSVENDKTAVTVMDQAPAPQMLNRYAMPAPSPMPSAMPSRMGSRDGSMRGGRGFAPPPAAAPPSAVMTAPAAPAAPMTILAESPLLVTLSVDVVKLNAEH